MTLQQLMESPLNYINLKYCGIINIINQYYYSLLGHNGAGKTTTVLLI